MPSQVFSLKMDIKQLDALRERLASPLPGWKAQKLLSPVQTNRYIEDSDSAKKAGVNLLLFPEDTGELGIFFIKRPDKNPNDKHGGQISFPGGQEEEGDQDLIETALRETEEEIGVSKFKTEVLGTLSPLYVFVSNFHVQPVVSFIDHKPALKLQESEVNYVITEKLSYLSSKEALANKDYKVRNYIMRNMPYYKLQNDILWGATAMITSEFMHIMREIR